VTNQREQVAVDSVWFLARSGSSSQAGSGVHPASCRMSTGARLLGRKADYSSPSDGDVRNDGVIPPLPHVFMPCCLFK
jgi:hypothetical protein